MVQSQVFWLLLSAMLVTLIRLFVSPVVFLCLVNMIDNDKVSFAILHGCREILEGQRGHAIRMWWDTLVDPRRETFGLSADRTVGLRDLHAIPKGNGAEKASFALWSLSHSHPRLRVESDEVQHA